MLTRMMIAGEFVRWLMRRHKMLRLGMAVSCLLILALIATGMGAGLQILIAAALSN